MTQLSAGTRVGPYEVSSLLGEGGMGQVYRARDTRLNRDVALKVLPEVFQADADRLARFRREAQLLASLNHPQIAAIHGLEESNGITALVLELVDGPTLADRIASGPIAVDEALPIARQISEALEAAHDKGVVHRDLKPANVKLTMDGRVKVLDFGLAKLLDADSAASGSQLAGATNSPTLTTPAMTMAGMLLGTAAYMSPEQARGKPVDKRADIWAFGCVLFEMLIGRRAFEGETISDVLARVIEREPDWTALPAGTPARLRELLGRCLKKDPRARLRDIGEARIQIDELLSGVSEEPPVPPTPGRRLRGRLVAASLALVAGAMAATVTWALTRPSSRPQLMRFAIVPPAAHPLVTGNAQIVISPDGRNLLYTTLGAPGGSQLMLRGLDQLDPVPLRGTLNARTPFFSPDGKWVGFFSDRELKKVPIVGGAAITISRVIGTPRGASWGPDDRIIFATADPTTGLLSVSAAGGDVTVLTKPDGARGEADHTYPSILPGGAAVMFTITAKGPNPTASDPGQIAVMDLKTGRRKPLIRSGTMAQYVDSGHLVYADAGTLLAARFDLGRLEVVSDAVPVVERVLTVIGIPSFSVSPHGTLVYLPGEVGVAGAAAPRRLLWVDRQGKEEPINLPLRTYTYPRLSPEGTKVAVDIRDQETDIWIADLKRETLTRLTFDPANDFYPVWTPDGQKILFNSNRAGNGDIFWQPADGTGKVERVTMTTTGPHYPYSMSSDGRSLVFQDTQPNTGIDLSLLSFETPSVPPPADKALTASLIHTTSSEANAEVSPDGHWIAYQSNESGIEEIYVRPFPNVDNGRWQISNAGGTRPLWARDGRELFYLDGDGYLSAVVIQTAPAFAAGSSKKILGTRYFSGFGGSGQAVAGRTYDVSPDGKRFLMIKEKDAGDANAGGPGMVVVLNWSEELAARVPNK